MVSLDITFCLGTQIYFEHRCRWKMNLIREQEISKNEIQPQIMTTIFFYEKRILIFLGPPVSSTNKTDSHDITEILLKVALSTNNQIKKSNQFVI